MLLMLAIADCFWGLLYHCPVCDCVCCSLCILKLLTDNIDEESSRQQTSNG
jgi:hypothetical protein